jgi:predicted 3-demethylubiquinone-9 3-methyltransferase (glyoxalase superfamily)
MPKFFSRDVSLLSIFKGPKRLLSVQASKKDNQMQKITPCLWFDDNAEEAVNFYTSVFKNSKLKATTHYGEAGYEIHGKPAGSVLTMVFELNGQEFTALNGGPMFKFNEAVSFQVNCETQEDIDYYWAKLSQGGDKTAQQCGWLKDKYGVSWQVVPTILSQLMSDPKKSEKVMNAVLQMKKIDIKSLKQASEG